MTQSKKVYDYNKTHVKNKLVAALKKRRQESTVADLMSETGLPKYQVEDTIREVADEYQGHLRATESGEILYYFPSGMRSSRRGFAAGTRRLLGRLARAAGKVLATLFKVWIVVMLVGYFVLFVALLVLSIVASVAASAASRGRSARGGGIFSFYLAMRAFQLFAWIWLTSGTGSYRQRGYGKRGRRLHKSAFAYVFGEEGVNRGYEERERAHILRFIRGRRGVVTMDELKTMTGRDEEEAQMLVNRLLLEWEGEPQVTDQGSLVFFFPSLLKSRTEEIQRAEQVPLMMHEKRRIIPFNNNPRRTNRWLTFFNGFNILFSSYFLYLGLTNPEPVFYVIRGVERLKMDLAFVYHYVHGFLASTGVESPERLVIIVLGIVPLAFSVFFYLIPWVRRRIQRRENERIRQENLRKKLYFQVLGNADGLDAESVRPAGDEETPKSWQQFVRKTLDRLAALRGGEVEQKGKERFVYRFPEIERELRDVEQYRAGIDLSRYQVGATVFDSGAEAPDAAGREAADE